MIETDPELLALLDEETEAIKTSSKRTPRFKLDEGQEAVVRILPAKLGDKKTWWTRTATHWLGKSARLHCVRKTSRHFGGDPDYDCPICKLVDKYNESENKKLSDAAYGMSARTNYDIYLVVRTIDGDAASRDQREIAQLYTVYSSSMDDLLTLYRRKLTKGVDITDPLDGYDLFIKRGRRGMVIDLDEQTPLFNIEDESKLEQKILSTLGTIHFKNPSDPTDQQLDEFTEKALDYLRRAKSRGSDADEDDEDNARSRRRNRSVDDDDEDNARSRRRSRSDDDDNGGDTRSRRSEDHSRAPVSDDEDSFSIPSRRERGSRNTENRNDDGIDMTPKPKRELESRRAEPPARTSAPPPPPARRSSVSETVDEDDSVADERREHVPPADSSDDVVGVEEPVQVDDDLKGSLRDRIKQGIKNIKK